MDSTHEPSHPKLLDWLAEDFRRSDYNIRRLIRAIALSKPYRLQSVRPEGADDPALFAWSLEKPLTAEQLTRSVSTALRGQTSIDKDARSLLQPLRSSLPDILPDESVTPVGTALFLSNNPALNQFVAHSQQPDHLIPRLVGMQSDQERIDLLFQTIFGRPASSEERQVVCDFLQSGQSDETRLTERLLQAAWSMLTSAEFHFNH